MPQATDVSENFIKIVDIHSPNSHTSRKSSLKSMIQGPGIGFSLHPPFDFISVDSWRTYPTDRASINFFEQYPEPIVIDLHLGDSFEVDAIGFWPSALTIAHSVRDFTIQFDIDGKGKSFSNPISKRAFQSNPHNLEIFSFPKIKTGIIRLTIFSNHGKEIGLPGNRVSLQEITVIKDHQAALKGRQTALSSACHFDFLKSLVADRFTDFEYAALNIRSEFSLDHQWKENSGYDDFLTMRGFRLGGGQLRRIDLSKWADKIYVYHFLQEHGIKGMPIILYTQRISDDFIDQVKQLYYDGLRSFVIKHSHLAYGTGIMRVKDGRFIPPSAHLKGKRVGRPVDFEFINTQIKKYWFDQQFTEEWASLLVPPAMILEELLDEPVELKFTLVFGEVIGFFKEDPELQTFDTNGKSLKDSNHTPPHWWHEAMLKAQQVADLVRADHIRIDLFYHQEEVIVCEITWCGVEMPEHYDMIAEKLNQGYATRKKYLQQLKK